MADFIFNTTPSIHQKWGGAADLSGLIDTLPNGADMRRILMITDPGITRLGLANGAINSLKQAGRNVQIFDGVEPDPKVSSVEKAVEIAREIDVDLIVGFGGGSAMDVAKVAALCANSIQPLEAMFGVNQATGTRLPLVLVPTTAGTGSEVTAVSILTTGTAEKKGVVTPRILPDLALLDASLTVGLPSQATAATGIDAMVHAIEAYTSRSANNNPMSRGLATQALTLLGGHIRGAVMRGDGRADRSNMLLGAMLAGQAFANSPVAAVHALAYPIGSLFKVPHGLSNALVLREVMRFNAPNCASEYAALAPFVFSTLDLSGGDAAVSDRFITQLDQLSHDLGLTGGLRSVGITEADLPKLASDAMNQTRLLVNNPRPVTEADALAIYQASL